MKKIVIFNALQTSLSGGIGRYSYELSKQLYIDDPQNIKIVVRKEDLSMFKFAKPEDLIIVENIKNSRDRNLYEQFKLPKLVYKKYPSAIIHYPDSMAPLFTKNKVIITIHDLAFKSLKNVFTWKTVLWKTFMTNLSIKKANKVISITNFTKSEILKHYKNIKREEVEVVYNGFNDFSNEKINEENIRSNIKNINKSYILTVSTISPRKNIDGLIKAFNNIKNDINEILVIAGDNGWRYESVFKLVEDLKLEDKVIFTGKINDDELKFLYKNCNVMIYASHYEGFGLPPLESLSYGKKCIVSDIEVFREVYKDGTYYFNQNSYEDMSIKIKDILKGKVEKKEFKIKYSWIICSEKTNEVYSKIR